MRTKIILIILITVLVLIFLFFNINFFKSFFLDITTSITVFLSEKSFEIKKFWLSLVNYNQIMEEYSRILIMNNYLNSTIAELKSIEEENEDLRKIIELDSKEKLKLIDVNLYLLNFEIGNHYAFIDKGKSSNLNIGLPVVIDGNLLVGKVDEVFDNNSKIKLVTDPNESLHIRIGKNIFGLARGSGNGDIELEFISIGEDIKIGDAIFTSGKDGLRKDLLVGFVKEIGGNESGLFKDVIVETPIGKVNSTNAFVILN